MSWPRMNSTAVPLARRRVRRTLVIVMYGGLLCYAVGMNSIQLLDVHSSPVATLGVLALLGGLIAAMAGFIGLARTGSMNAVNATPDQLDERLAARRNATLALAFRIMAIACALEFVVWQFTSIGSVSGGAGWRSVPHKLDLASVFLMGDLLLTITLPMAIFAWTEPDPDPVAE